MSAPFHHLAHNLLSSSRLVGGGGEGVDIFSFGQEGGSQKILYDVGVMKKICPFKIYPLPPSPPPAV